MTTAKESERVRQRLQCPEGCVIKGENLPNMYKEGICFKPETIISEDRSIFWVRYPTDF